MWLSRLRATEPPVHARRRRRRRAGASALRSSTVLLVGLAYLAVGAVFGAMDVVVVGLRRGGGRPGAGRASRWPSTPAAAWSRGWSTASSGCPARWPRGTSAARSSSPSPPSCCSPSTRWSAWSPSVFVAGLAIAPVLVSGMSLVESRVPRSALTEALTWVVTGLTLGVTAGSALAGAGGRRLGRRDGVRRPGAVRGAGRAAGPGRRAAAGRCAGRRERVERPGRRPSPSRGNTGPPPLPGSTLGRGRLTT